ncbi:MAG: glycosyltransferase family 2 protein [Acidimicrobiia bacterium]|nr:glycosyltransferase family 2 protein [Acidimicrobiia bacterium]
MAGDYRISFVLPAFNEEANVSEAIRRVRDVAQRLCSDYEIVVVDDGSTDGTAARVEAAANGHGDVVLLRHPRNRGYGEALRTGFRAAHHELIFFTDSDNQFDLGELELFLPWIDRADVVAGYRINRQDRWARRVIGRSWNYLVRALFYVPVRDIDCAFKLFRSSVFEDIDLASVGAMVNTELMVKLGRSGAGVVEIGVTHYPRTAGTARGASVKVVTKALTELVRMYRHLDNTTAGTAQPSRSA